METSYLNKPYFFAPLSNRVDRSQALNRQNLLTDGTYLGKLIIAIECMTPLHFGSGQVVFDDTTNRFPHSLLRENGKIALPGSSFKGALRSVFEAVTESCILNAPRELPLKIGGLSACSDSSGLCPTCSVFGRLSYKGKLTISSFYTDAEPVSLNVPPLERPFKTYPIRKGERDPRTGNERLYYGHFRDIKGLDVAKMSKGEFLDKKKIEPKSGGNFYGRKFYKHSSKCEELAKHAGKDDYECLPIGAVLIGNIIYQGLTEDELGALLFALGLGWGHTVYHKLGYAKPAYFGSVKLTVTSEPLPRYENSPLSADDAERMAARYYNKHKASIEAAVSAMSQSWSEIGESNWKLQDGKYGY